MAVNLDPTFPLTMKVSWGLVITADATAAKNHNGTASTAVLLFTAGVNGAIVTEIKAVPLGTNAASALRILLNNGSDPTSAANNSLLFDESLPAITISEIAGQTAVQVLEPGDERPITLPAGYKLYGCIGTTVAAGWQVSVIGGDY